WRRPPIAVGGCDHLLTHSICLAGVCSRRSAAREERHMALAVGTRLGPYEIVSPLGAGGMGEVFRARDPRLGREVAVKVLPTALSNDSARLLRFEQEARAAAALNHPNILAVYDI